jgi:formamidopyrimidine-DNA glycosylase
MPELPEVESFRKYIADTSLHQKIENVRTAAQGMLIETTDADLKHILKNNSFEDTFRHGKFLFIRLRFQGSLMLHFGMTGDLLYYYPDKSSPKSYVLLFEFDNGHWLSFSDPRRLGKISLVEDVQAFIDKRGYGEDALQISWESFYKILKKKRTAIKVSLMDQKVVAGVGNEFSDELLFQTKVHPASITAMLPEKKLKEVYESMQNILKEAVSHDADRKKLKHYFFLGNRKAGLRCPRCKGETEWQTIGGRSSYFCSACQKLYR